MKWCALGLVCLVLGGCSSVPVQAWQKKHLARQDMALDVDPLQSRYAAHVYTSKEGASGGQGVGGGGCGCN